MDWEEQLITIYLYVCKKYKQNLCMYCQRMSNHADLRFSDEEVITLYLFGIIDRKQEIKHIHDYAERHLRSWFPRLSSYAAFMQRLNRILSVFVPLLESIQSDCKFYEEETALLVDSFPIALAKQGHRFKACVAPEYADHGYCSTKKLYYYGVKVHVLGRRKAGTLPLPKYIGVTPASHNDGKVFDQIRSSLVNEEVFGDKAYLRPDAELFEKLQNLKVLTPVKKQTRVFRCT